MTFLRDVREKFTVSYNTPWGTIIVDFPISAPGGGTNREGALYSPIRYRLDYGGRPPPLLARQCHSRDTFGLAGDVSTNLIKLSLLGVR